MVPFTADVVFASFEASNRALWPLHLVAIALALAAVALTFRPVSHGDRAVATFLAAAWIWVGIGWFYLRFATIDFAAPLYAACFVLEGLLVAWTGIVRGEIAFRFRAGPYGWTGLALAAAALVGYPLADGLAGPGWPSVRLVGLAPGPTTAFTFGLLLLVEGRTPLILAVVPLLWTLVAGVTGWVLDIAQDQALALASLGGFALILGRSWRRPRGVSAW